MSTEVFLDKG